MSIASLIPLLSATLATAQVQPAPECQPIPGWERVVANETVRWIVVGEMHGTAETPAMFADAVCLTAEARGPVVVALEIPSDNQDEIDAFMASNGGPQAQLALLEASHWHPSMADGRSSEAMFGLLERLRHMHWAGLVARVVAFVDSSPVEAVPEAWQGWYEERLAAIVRGAAGSDAIVVGLVGNTHARKTEVDFGRRYMPMAALLPAEQAVTLYTTGTGGEAWNCTRDACGPHENRGPPGTRGVELQPLMGGAYDGLLQLGVETTASPPQPAP